jgi:hypothetical protein
MLLDQVTDTQLRAGQIAAGATMAAFLAARYFRNYAQSIRLTVAAIYIGGVIGLLLYFLL